MSSKSSTPSTDSSSDTDESRMEESNSDGDFEEDPVYGRWPRRLLHVPSMTSYAWQEGNQYGEHVAPRYNILSYTWGRWGLRDDNAMPHVTAIAIKGVSWNIPRIDPVHFSTKEFRHIIRRATIVQERLSHPDAPVEPVNIEFLWLDVACIDQRRGSPEGQLEIGRQALIFKHAHSACIWLSHTSAESLQRISRNLDSSTFELRSASGNHENSNDHKRVLQTWLDCWLLRLDQDLGELLLDPYLSSLWTLQEGFLRFQARLLSKDGTTVSLVGYLAAVSLASIGHLYGRVQYGLRHSLALRCTPKEQIQKLLRKIERSGLTLIVTKNPVTLYTAAAYRTTTRPEDRVYGIMQIFGFRLGVSAKSSTAGKKYELEELEDQLGKKLLNRYPVESQLNIHTKRPKRGQAWRVSSSSATPTLATIATHWSWAQRGPQKARHKKAPQALCQLSPCDVDGMSWCWFRGKSCSFDVLQAAWKQVNRDGEASFSSNNKTYDYTSPIHEIALDLDDERSAPSSSPSEKWWLSDILFDGHEVVPEQQHLLAERIVQRFKSGCLRVLLLGKHGHPFWKEKLMLGLILLKEEQRNSSRQETKFSTWRRLGVCRWELFDLRLPQRRARKLLGFLDGSSEHWQVEEGVFG
ncbi:hypothetical protein MMC20_003683 [Loxospora ochrophaea]|nr:hypothetical protein [Loxospora ochrophaea]